MTNQSRTEDLRAGLERVALDLHVHSPASRDWRDGDVSADDLVARALAQGLDGIAIVHGQPRSDDWIAAWLSIVCRSPFLATTASLSYA
jgi:hypothetical protein